MSVAVVHAESKRTLKLLTVADVAAFPADLPSGPVRYELDNGKLVIMPPPGNEHGAIESNLAADLKVQGERRGLGKARSGDVGLILWRNPDRLVGADAVFFTLASLPIRESSEGYLETIPDLVVEVLSKNDRMPQVLQKVKDNLKAGVRVAWVVDPKKKTVTAHRRGRKPHVFHQGDLLTVEDIIPGFQTTVRDVFQQ